jgi:superfamily II DNA or RNA helicase
MAAEVLIPIDGCWVRRPGANGALGFVLGNRKVGERVELQVAWGSSDKEWIPVTSLRCGFQLDWTVQDVPISATRKSLGQGRVIGRRELGGREQLLVQLDDDGRSIWLPYENLRRLKDARMRYVRAESGVEDHAERFRLKLLAHALENWNYLTGSLDRLDVDPLPHQIQLVHRILSSGNYNWLIADDVGLGKTIEVGLLLAALKRKGQARRVLVVSPAGLTRQWQDELQFKFDQDYQIYGRDFLVNKPEHWKLHDHVIVSLDLAKRDEHMTTFRQAGGWDVVVFDEGHKLTRYASGERAQRYKLAEMLRPAADAFLLLSGTPHQGYADRFISLLDLVRPDLRPQLHTLETNPEIVSELILRNRKSEVTDADGAFIFKGQKVHRVPIEPSDETRHFQALLRDYLVRGYKAGAAAGTAGRAIGFVMTTYRKLASSSIAAIEHALELRRERLTGEARQGSGSSAESDLSLDDLTEGGDEQDDLSETISATTAGEFFAFERDLIDGLLAHAILVREQDEKLRIFLDQVVAPLISEEKKLLVFTEYRATQRYLKDALESRYPEADEILLINGSMKLDEKLSTIEAFNEGPNRFLVSTEAGGEGLNLHHACHVMVNYDLPWNPARLVQRIGRLYRYGQQEPVIVFNLHARDSFDNAAIDLMMNRVGQIVLDMAPVGTEFNDRLYAEILGDVLDHLDFASVLQSTTSMELERTREQIDDAVARAQRAKQLQDEIFTHIIGYDPSGLRGTLGFTMQHVDVFIRGMLPIIEAVIEDRLYSGRVLEIRLHEDMRGEFPEFGQRTVVRVTTDRRLALRLGDVVLLDFENSFFQHLISHAKSQRFDGIYASVQSPIGSDGVLAAFRLRWQNDQGEPLTEEFVWSSA